MTKGIHPVILSGGTGTRLWPMSRRSLPKQFLPLVAQRTLLQETVARLAGLPECAAPIIVSNNEHRFIVAEQLNELGVRPAVQILEPTRRNTAPAAAVAALYTRPQDPEGLLLVLPSDHAIGDAPAFPEAAAAPSPLPRQGLVVTFGIRPAGPHPGYRSLQAREPM